MSLKGKDTFSKWGCSRAKSSLGKLANNRFWPVTWILRRFANVRLLAAVGTDGRSAAPGPHPCHFRFIITKEFLAVMSETVQTLSF
jgi:hypothetical protein